MYERPPEWQGKFHSYSAKRQMAFCPSTASGSRAFGNRFSVGENTVSRRLLPRSLSAVSEAPTAEQSAIA